MANEFTATLSLSVSNGEFVDVTETNFRDDQTTKGGGNPGTVEIGTSEETISFGDVSPGWVLMKNLEDSGGNYVEYGPDSTGMVAIGRLNPGATHIFKLTSGVTLKAQANTAAVKVLVKGYDS